MKKKLNLYYIAIIAAIFLMLGISKVAMMSIRGVTASTLTPLWNTFTHFKSQENPYLEENEALQVQNYLLESELKKFKELHSSSLSDQLDSIPARVIYRSPASWNSTLWINVGNLRKNSVVLSGTSIIGVIEQSSSHQSSVRLITDSNLTPSVRVKRNGTYLAKGFTKGSSQPMWRKRAKVLQGFGFNYDFDDDEGPARDLRSQDPSIIEVGDLLVTTGMDGVFPPDLEVARVKKIKVLKEGDYSYELETEPTAKNLEDLSIVRVLF